MQSTLQWHLLCLVESRIPAQDAEVCLLEYTVGHAVVETVLRFRGREPSVVGTTENRIGTS